MKTSKIWKMYTRDELKVIVKTSKTFVEILSYFDITNIGGNSNTLKRRLNEENIDYSHIPQGAYASRGRINYHHKGVDPKLVLTKDSKYCRSTARSKILNNELLEYKCQCCGIGPEWNGNKLVLRLDHINGIRNDHRLENLRFVCPNCDSQLPTYGGKNIDRPKPSCVECGSSIYRNSKTGLCRKCVSKSRVKTERPSKAELSKLVWELPSTKIAEIYGVSDKSISKWCKAYGIEKPGPGYWMRKKKIKNMSSQDLVG